MAQQTCVVPAAWREYVIKNDMTDDSKLLLMKKGATVPASLQKRLLKRLSALVGASVTRNGGEQGQPIQMLVTYDAASPQTYADTDEIVRPFLQKLELALQNLPSITNSSNQAKKRGDLWNIILSYSNPQLDATIKEMKRCFESNNKHYADMITRSLWGEEDKDNSALYMEVILLHDMLQDYDGTTTKQLAALIRFSATILKKFDPLCIRLDHLLQNTQFADDLYYLVCILSFPGYASYTFIAAAETDPAFRRVKFVFRDYKSPEKHMSFKDMNVKASQSSASPPSSKSSELIIPPHKASLRQGTAGASMDSSSPKTTHLPDMKKQDTIVPNGASLHAYDIMAIVRPYLSERDQKCTFGTLESNEKRTTIELVATVLRDNMLSKGSPAWYTFGFVTARDEEEERYIGGLYKMLITASKRPQGIFADITTGIQQGTLVDILESSTGFKISRNSLFPYLATFLSTPTPSQPTVWHLIQYLSLPPDSYIEPKPVLKRDYGFRNCRNHQDVSQLKSMYKSILTKAQPLELHAACVHGRLEDFARQRGLRFPKGFLRLLRNDWPLPAVGLDNGEGLRLYQRPLFRRPLVKS